MACGQGRLYRQSAPDFLNRLALKRMRDRLAPSDGSADEAAPDPCPAVGCRPLVRLLHFEKQPSVPVNEC